MYTIQSTKSDQLTKTDKTIAILSNLGNFSLNLLKQSTDLVYIFNLRLNFSCSELPQKEIIDLFTVNFAPFLTKTK